MITLIIKASTLRALNRVASTDETRCVINGVHVEIDSDGYTLVATDGRRLIAFHEGDQGADEAVSFIIPSMLIRLSAPSGKLEITYTDSGKVSLEGDLEGYRGVELRSLAINGKYPNWRAVVPKEWPTIFNGGTLRVNHEYLKSACNALSEISGQQAVLISQASELDPICILATGVKHSNLLAIVMPVRGGEGNNPALQIPAWGKSEA